MKFYNLNSYYIVTDIKEHENNKQKFLNLIEKIPESSLEGISKTDWNLPRDFKREYLDYFYEVFRPYMNEMATKLKCKNWNIGNGWFQIYDKNDKHTWHIHQQCNYTNVYFLHLPNNSIKTHIYDLMTDTMVDDLEVKEGQVLTLPSNYIHRSPTNNTNDKKVIISFNSNFDEVDLTI